MKEVENGTILLEGILANWENNQGTKDDSYRIFFPKCEKEKDINYVLFPIFKKEDDGKLRLEVWGKYDINKYALKEYIQEKRKIFIDDEKEIDYKDNKYFDIIKTFVNVFYIAQQFLKLQENTPEYIATIELLDEKIEEYDKEFENLLKDKNIKKIYIKEQEINEEKLEIKEENENVSEKTKDEEAKKVKEEKPLLNMPDEYNSTVENFAFEINNPDGLKYVSDAALEIAFRLIKDGKIKLSYKEKTEKSKSKLIIKSSVISFCDYTVTTEELLENLRNNPQKYFTKKENSWEISSDRDINKVCPNCKLDKCPKVMAGYILYLYGKGLLQEKLEEREKFRKENQVYDKFDFIWNVKDGLKNVSDKTFEFCKKIVEENRVWVSNRLTTKNSVKIESLYTCEEYKKFNNDIKNLTRPIHEFNKNSKFIVRPNNYELDYCDSYSCRLNECPFVIAGYIQYLQKTGQNEKIEEDRKYYKEHKEEIDKKIIEHKEEKLKKLDESKNDLLEKLNEFNDKVPDIASITEGISNSSQTNFHCIIEGNDEETKDKLILKIAEILFEKKKLNSPTVIKLSMQNLAAYNAYKTSYNMNEFDKNGIKYCVQDAIRYTELKENTLYIINGISEFIEDYRRIQSSYGEVRFKQFKHILELLTKMEPKNYIIINSTEKEINELLDLEPKLKFIYQNYIYKVKDLTLDEIYELYVSKIKSDLIDDVRENGEKYKKEFKDYVSLNQKFIPFSSRELASYLADYSNSKNKIVFPDNMYKKETVEESLRKIIGLNSLKEKVKEFEKYMLFQIRAKSNGLKIKNANMHMIFTGNPGTGKTTIARIMAKMLFDLGLIKENKLIEVERKDLIAQYTGQTAPKTAEVIDKAMGGVLFIDEAYSLTEGKDSFGLEAIATLIKAMEDHKGEFVVIFAGYKDEMKTFMDSNPGIASRIGYTFDFPDYSPKELVQMFMLKMQNMGFKCEEGIEKLIENICEYYTKRKAFGNGRFVDKLMQEVTMKHALNDNEEIDIIYKKDIPTIEELTDTGNNNKGEALKQLDNIIGMDVLKERIKEFEDYVLFQNKAKALGLNLKETNMNMIFTGNPGTGKTTIARIMAKMLFDLGVIKENKLVEVEKKDLIAQYIGQTAPKTAEVIDKAMGGVLFIDEAYSLTDGNKNDANVFGLEAIATLIKAMEDHKGEFVVIFAGYKDEMKIFVESNPGIASRIGYTFDFPDYTPDELIQIFNLKMKNMGFALDKEIEVELKSICTYFSKRKAFGNGRFVDKLMQEVIMKHAKNKDKDIKKITKKDIPTIEELNNTKIEEELDIEKQLEKIIGMKEVKEKIKEFEQYAKFVKKAHNNKINLPNQNMNMIFTGNPGTGKTTIARIMAKMLSDLGIIHENKLIEVEKKDLVGQYTGQTAPKTAEVIDKAMGGVLFIDEAYSLTEGKDSFGLEAIATLIKAMEDHKGEFVVIFAGYKKEMQDFVDSNPGIASRIGYTFDFKDYDEYELAEILYKKIEKADLKITEEAKEPVAKIMKYFCKVENIGNGRFTDKVFQEILMKHAKNTKAKIDVIEEDDIPTIKEMTEVVFNGSGMIDPTSITKETTERVAIHEVGHALVRLILFDNPGIMRITINAEGTGALGYVLHTTNPEKPLRTRTDILNDIKVSMAGMAAEQVYLGEFSNGNSSDLENATRRARYMIRYSGMSSLGFGQIFNIQGEMEKEVQIEVNKILNEAFEGAVEIIKENKKKMDNVVKYLLKNREITEEEFKNNLK